MAVDRNLRQTLSFGTGFAERVRGVPAATGLWNERTERDGETATWCNVSGSMFSDAPSNGSGLLFTAKV
ncbi:hypothetical protein D9V28_01330 [Mycetocola zhadangensis]|uniref:Uncharacterized protein n=1 Tax=Mycetocola zhadangensis TaxID=1164595 RepID=A0A3L7J534_9MICO|nr:hypothetical protein D9V28_01330 [Mycetocola zhadangensis]GGE83706.1 hypothetical protein GCM10011313_02640 [Mycetocola zhadangensis]